MKPTFMFSQLRHAVESLTVPPSHNATDVTPDDKSSSNPPQSADTSLGPTAQLLISSSQLAESPMSSLRKSFTISRGGSPMEKSASLPCSKSEKPRQKMNLEERLRASLSTGDVSTTSSSPRDASLFATVSNETSFPESMPLTGSPISSSPPLNSQGLPLSPESQDEHIGLQTGSTYTESQESTDQDTQNENASTNISDEDVDVDDLAVEAKQGDDEAESASAGRGSDRKASEECQTRESSGGDFEFYLEPNISSINAQNKQCEQLKVLEALLAMPIGDASVDALQKRLQEVEQCFSDVSISFKRLRGEKLAADSVLRNSTPLEGIQDPNALKEYLESLKSKTDVFQEEIKRLNGKLEVQEDRMEELRETHKLSSSAQTKQIDLLQGQLRETDALFKDAEKGATKLKETLSQKEKEISALKSNAEHLNTVVKEEEEKRTKAISLLKSIRQKLVKAEKDKEDALKELATLRNQDRVNADKEQIERKRFEREIEAVHAEKETSLENVRTQFEKEMASLKERHEKAMVTIRSQFELDAITTKSSHNKEIASKNSHINTLETSLNSVTRDKNSFFEQLQLRQAEAESAQSHLENIQHQNTELQFQLREANDRVNLLKEDLNELQREQNLRAREPSTSTENIAHLLASMESKYEAKVAELRRINAMLEKERNESEAEWSRKLKDRGAEIEDLKRLLGNTTKSHEREEETVAELQTELARKEEEVLGLEHQIADLSKAYSRLEASSSSDQTAAIDLQTRIAVLDKQIEESKTRDTQLRQTNKSLREELRKVQSSAALLERQRNPGVGYWTTRTSERSPSNTATTTTASSPSTESTKDKEEEEVNIEYLRNVILQFLEHKEMRPNLVRVLSIILRFTPQETRRLMSKV